MSGNKYGTRILVIPEDDANADLVNGFLLHPPLDQRVIRVQSCAGGWSKVREKFHSDFENGMKRYPNRHVVFLIDFDERDDRLEKMTSAIPEALRERVFVLGIWKEAEEVTRVGLGTREEVGFKLASECFDEDKDVWNHDMLRHNANDLAKLEARLRQFLFPPR